VLDDVDGDRRLFRSPLRVYRLLVDLTELTRRHGGLPGAATFYRLNNNGRQPKKVCRQGVTTPDVAAWARSHGFPPSRDATAETKPGVDVRKVRQTAIEQRRHPVAHTRQTMNDVYLRRSRTVQADSRHVVAAALREQVGKARRQQGIAVFTAEFLLRAQRDPAAAAAEAGLDPSALQALLVGHQDTAVAACTNNRSSPHAEPGEPCPASFLACLDCENARALPHHLPIQVIVRDRIGALRPNLDAALWRYRYEQPLNRLDDLLSHHTPAERAQARREISPTQLRLVDDLMNGRLDLR
jgi:hypothetical protein